MYATLYLPEGIDSKILSSVQQRAAEKFGGFTMVQGEGGWVNDDGKLIHEKVDLIRVAGADEKWVQSTADWVARKSDETEVHWSVTDGNHGFERGTSEEKSSPSTEKRNEQIDQILNDLFPE
jgi:hypothetical protein